MAERLNPDDRAVRRVRRLRDKYGAGPLMLQPPVESRNVIIPPVRRAARAAPVGPSITVISPAWR
jgi:hypothetical protein